MNCKEKVIKPAVKYKKNVCFFLHFTVLLKQDKIQSVPRHQKGVYMNISLDKSSCRFSRGIELLQSVTDIFITPDGLPVTWDFADKLTIARNGNTAHIQGENTVQFFRGLGILKERLEENCPFRVTEMPVFKQLGASFDLSRNAVMTPRSLEKMLCRMALMGYNEAYLYTEETYDLPEYPFFGYMRGKYTAEELCALDDKAALLGIELIPCIQTLGHLERFLHWESSAPLRDTQDVLLVDEEDSYLLIEAMLRQCRKCYRTNKIHVGMDEAMNLGLGGYLKKHGYQNSFSLMQRHVERVRQLAKKYDFKPMMWSDMYFRCASPHNDYYEDRITIPQAVVEAAPKDMELVYWDYYHEQKEFYDRYIKLHRQFSAPLHFAGGMWTWLGPAIDYEVFFKNAKPALKSCVENNVENVMITAWGDDGGETSPQTMLLGLQAYAEYCYEENFEKEWIFKRLYACTRADGSALQRISAFNKTELLDKKSDLPNGAKFLLYQDPLTGIFDFDVENMGFAKQYEKLEEEFAAYVKRNDIFKEMYQFYMLLARVLKNKAELGISLYRAYELQNKQKLEQLAKQALEAANDCGDLLEQWRKLWLLECRPFGFEILEIRVAGVQSRLKTTAHRVLAFCAGDISGLDELEVKRLPILRREGTNQMHGAYFWRDIVSASKPS